MPRPARKAELDEGPSAARRFSDTVRQILGVPKAELDKREAAYKRGRQRKKRDREAPVTPGPKATKSKKAAPRPGKRRGRPPKVNAAKMLPDKVSSGDEGETMPRDRKMSAA